MVPFISINEIYGAFFGNSTIIIWLFGYPYMEIQHSTSCVLETTCKVLSIMIHNTQLTRN